MKEPNRAPMYATMYRPLCDIAREHGYALAIHGSLMNDMDLIAVPWVEEPSPAIDLVDAIKERLGMCMFDVADKNNPVEKPHGRIAWNIYMDNGCKIDLSVLPTR